ncbi:MAG: DNA mismatch repair protein MutT, partial [Chloroflexi bacterium]|nr:DNA mismatch repair protein MutT [Chloroflexota bacterium]
FMGLYSLEGNPVILAVYSAHITGGNMQAGHDAQEAAWFPLNELNDLPFPHDQQILSDWRGLI